MDRDGSPTVRWLAAIALGLVIAGCGGGPATTRAGWVAAADAVCSRYGPGIAALGSNPIPLPQLAAHLRANLALTRPELAEVEALPRPGGADGAAIAATIETRRKALDAIAAAERLAVIGIDPASDLAQAHAYAAAAKEQAQALGMTVCSAPAPASGAFA